MSEAAVLPAPTDIAPQIPSQPDNTSAQQEQKHIPDKVALICDRQGNAILPSYYATDDNPGFSIATQDTAGRIKAIEEKNFSRLQGENLPIRWNDGIRPDVKLGAIQLERYRNNKIVAYGRGNAQQSGELQVTIIDRYEHAQQLENEQAQKEGREPVTLDKSKYAGDEQLVMVRQSVQPRGASNPLTIARLYNLHEIPVAISKQEVREITQKATDEVDESVKYPEKSKPVSLEGPREALKKAIDKVREMKGAKMSWIKKAGAVLAGLRLLSSHALPIAPVADTMLVHPSAEQIIGGSASGYLLPDDNKEIITGDENDDDLKPGKHGLTKPAEVNATDTVAFDSPDGTYWRGPAGQRVLEAYNKLYGTTYTDVDEIPEPIRNAMEHVNIDETEEKDPHVDVENVPKGKQITIYSEHTDEQLIKLLTKAGAIGNAELTDIREKLANIGAGIAEPDTAKKIEDAIQDGALASV